MPTPPILILLKNNGKNTTKMNKVKKIILYSWIALLGCFLWQNSALAGKVGEATEANEIEFLNEVFRVIMPIYIKDGYNQSDANFIEILKSGYIVCYLPPQEMQDSINSLSEDERTVARALQEIAPKYLCR
jgi:hypothetical protein